MDCTLTRLALIDKFTRSQRCFPLQANGGKLASTLELEHIACNLNIVLFREAANLQAQFNTGHLMPIISPRCN